MFRFVPRLALAACLSAALPPVASGTESSPVTAPDPAAVRLEERRMWATQVRELRAQERAELDSLARSVAQVRPGADQAQAQRELEEAKRAWRRRMLQAQLTRAQAAGKPEHAARLRARLTELDMRAAQRAAARSTGGER
jgi:hypothetical protein